MYSLLLITESKTQISWDNFWLCCTSHRFEPSLCSEQSELIPDPWYVPDNLTSGAKDLGSDVVAVGFNPL